MLTVEEAVSYFFIHFVFVSSLTNIFLHASMAFLFLTQQEVRQLAEFLKVSSAEGCACFALKPKTQTHVFLKCSSSARLSVAEPSR